jgi:hypothetical protein
VTKPSEARIAKVEVLGFNDSLVIEDLNLIRNSKGVQTGTLRIWACKYRAPIKVDAKRAWESQYQKMQSPGFEIVPLNIASLDGHGQEGILALAPVGESNQWIPALGTMEMWQEFHEFLYSQGIQFLPPPPADTNKSLAAERYGPILKLLSAPQKFSIAFSINRQLSPDYPTTPKERGEMFEVLSAIMQDPEYQRPLRKLRDFPRHRESPSTLGNPSIWCNQTALCLVERRAVV